MPLAFTHEEQLNIQQKLEESAFSLVKQKSVKKITARELSNQAGISIGAFYKFYPTKEHLFYSLLRSLHDKVYESAMNELFASGNINPAERLRNSIIAGCDALDRSGMERFWTEDALYIMEMIPDVDKEEQRISEKTLYKKFFNMYGKLAVSEDLAMDALGSLLMSVSQRHVLGAHYPTILLWQADGVCNHIFE